jgi:hypothetical protein
MDCLELEGRQTGVWISVSTVRSEMPTNLCHSSNRRKLLSSRIPRAVPELVELEDSTAQAPVLERFHSPRVANSSV